MLASSDNGIRAEVRVRWVMHGDPATGVRIVLGGISADADVARWWPHQFGAGAALDPRHGALLGIDWIGARPPGWRCVTPSDHADAVAGVLDVLGIRHAEAIVGASYGGCVALAFAGRHAERVGRALVLCAAHRPAPMAAAQRALQRQIIRFAAGHGDPKRGVALARALAMTSYRSEAEFAARFDALPEWIDGRWLGPAERYLAARGAEFAARCDAERYLLLSESLDLHRVDPSSIDVPLHLLGIRSDRLVPLADIERLATDVVGPARLTRLSSLAGHDGFLTETRAIARWLRAALDRHAGRSRMRRPAGARRAARITRALPHQEPRT